MPGPKKIKYKAGYKYQLVDTYWSKVPVYPAVPISTRYATLSVDGLLILKKGFAWDGPSGEINIGKYKTVSIDFTKDKPDKMRASAEHDALYRFMAEGLLHERWRPYVDTRLYKVMIEDGAPKAEAKLWFLAVKRFARKYATAENINPILEAP